jgi:hypothetical protein
MGHGNQHTYINGVLSFIFTRDDKITAFIQLKGLDEINGVVSYVKERKSADETVDEEMNDTR